MITYEDILKAKDRDPQALNKIFQHSDTVLNKYLFAWDTNISPDALRVQAKRLTIKAIDNYDPSKGTTFDTHLYNHFKKLSRTIMYYSDTVRMPENQRLKVGKLMDTQEYLRDKLGREPSAQELSQELGWHIKETERLLNNITKEMPTDLDISNVHSKWTPTEAVIHSFYQELPSKEQVVLEHTLGLYGKPELKAKEIAKKLKISEASIVNIRKKLTQQLAEHLKNSGVID